MMIMHIQIKCMIVSQSYSGEV